MIKHHPKPELLVAYTLGQLPASLSAAISIHASMCPECQQQIEQTTELHAHRCFDDSQSFVDDMIETETLNGYFISEDLDAMMAAITADESQVQLTKHSAKEIEVKGQRYVLPQALAKVKTNPFSAFGKISRASLDLDEGDLHSHLLHIDAGGAVPSHTHKGFELTLLLEGSFNDESGVYHKGDFIMLDGSHEHTPVTKDGCLCLTIADDALKFTQGLSKLLNPIGGLIY